MKKILLSLIMLFLVTNAYAGIIYVQTLSNDDQVTYNYFNTSFNTVKNCINGNIESVNIKDGALGIGDFASAASPAQREGDHFNAYTKSGMLPPSAAGLTADITAGVSYVKSSTGLLYRVATDATSHTYTTAKDTWVYVDINVAFQFEEVAVGAAQPTTPANSLLLAKVNTSGGNMTATDYRTLSISLGTSDDMYKKGMGVLWRSGDTLSVDTGVVYVGTTRISKTSVTGLNVGTAGDYVSGASERGVNKTINVYCDDSGSIKLDDTVPDYHDSLGNTTGTKYYLKNGTEYWRILGSLQLSSADGGKVQVNQIGSTENKVIQCVNYQTGELSSKTPAVAITWDDDIPQSNEGVENMRCSITPTNANNLLKIEVVWNGCVEDSGRELCVALFQDSTAGAIACAQTETDPASTYPMQNIKFTHFMRAGTTAYTTFYVRAGSDNTSVITFNGETGSRKYGGIMSSSITITEIAG